MKRKVLITGALGYLGGRIALYLAKDNDYVLRLGVHRPGNKRYPEWVKKNNLEMVRLEILSGDGLDFACKGVDSVIHLAALNEIESLANPQQAVLINTIGTLKLIEAAQRAGVKRFIYFSTIHVYGAPLSGVITENTLTCPQHPYAITHRAAEDFVVVADKEKRLSGIVLRLSNGFGAPADHFIDRWTLVVNDLCRQAVTRRKLILKSSGLQGRDFLSLTDITRAASHALTVSTDRLDNCIFNLGGENSITIIELAKIIADRCGKVLGYIPQIIRPKANNVEIPGKIEYRIDKFKSTGFSLVSNRDEEIDATFRLCERYFKDNE